MSCPKCLSDDVEVREYDFGICSETGYHDAGERFRCRACGATGDADDLVADAVCNSISVGSSRAEVFLTVDGWHAAGSASDFFKVDAR